MRRDKEMMSFKDISKLIQLNMSESKRIVKLLNIPVIDTEPKLIRRQDWDKMTAGIDLLDLLAEVEQVNNWEIHKQFVAEWEKIRDMPTKQNALLIYDLMTAQYGDKLVQNLVKSYPAGIYDMLLRHNLIEPDPLTLPPMELIIISESTVSTLFGSCALADFS